MHRISRQMWLIDTVWSDLIFQYLTSWNWPLDKVQKFRDHQANPRACTWASDKFFKYRSGWIRSSLKSVTSGTFCVFRYLTKRFVKTWYQKRERFNDRCISSFYTTRPLAFSLSSAGNNYGSFRARKFVLRLEWLIDRENLLRPKVWQGGTDTYKGFHFVFAETTS